MTVTALLLGSVGLLADRSSRRIPFDGARRALAITISIGLSVFAVVSLVGNQALFAGRDDLERRDWAGARENARRAEALLVWSFEPELVLGDARAGLEDRDGAARAFRAATEEDPENWIVWLRLAQVAQGAERRDAYARVHELNPRDEDLPGESAPSSG